MTRTLQVAVFFLSLGCIIGWRYDRRPKVFDNEIPDGALQPNKHSMKRKIVFYHNFFRNNVQPPAANMLKMTWHSGAARAAQKWADKCLLLIHDNATGRYDDNYGECGQNIFVSSHKVPWFFAIKTWFLERHNFTYGSRNNDLLTVGHYTQMVWATTHEVGCAFTKCFRNNNKKFYNYICNYCPIGNKPKQLSTPYKRGKRCSLCKNSCNAKKLCTNSCPVADRWANCRELKASFPNWLCETQRHDSCKATCQCQGKIY